MMFIDANSGLNYYEEVNVVLTESDLSSIQSIDRGIDTRAQCVVGYDCAALSESTKDQDMEIRIPIATARLEEEIEDAKYSYPAKIKDTEPCYRFILTLQPGTKDCEPNTYIHYIARNGTPIRIILGSEDGVRIDPKDHTTFLRSTDDIDRKIILSFLVRYRTALIEQAHIQPSRIIYDTEVGKYMERRNELLSNLQRCAILYTVDMAPWRNNSRITSRDLSKIIDLDSDKFKAEYWRGGNRYTRDDFLKKEDWRRYRTITLELDYYLDLKDKCQVDTRMGYQHDIDLTKRVAARREYDAYVSGRNRALRLDLENLKKS